MSDTPAVVGCTVVIIDRGTASVVPWSATWVAWTCRRTTGASAPWTNLLILVSICDAQLTLVMKQFVSHAWILIKRVSNIPEMAGSEHFWALCQYCTPAETLCSWLQNCKGRTQKPITTVPCCMLVFWRMQRPPKLCTSVDTWLVRYSCDLRPEIIYSRHWTSLSLIWLWLACLVDQIPASDLFTSWYCTSQKEK
jgi:hypothetical protein